MAEKEYIEREAVINHIDSVVNNAPDADYRKAAWGFGVFVSRLPAADVVHVKHGHWIICSDGYYPYCSECKREPQGRAMTDYCPNCGAKMSRGD